MFLSCNEMNQAKMMMMPHLFLSLFLSFSSWLCLSDKNVKETKNTRHEYLFTMTEDPNTLSD